MDKIFLSADGLLKDSFELGIRIFESGYRPSYIVGVWRGGTPIGITVQEVLEYCGVANDHLAVRTSSYLGINNQSDIVRVYGLEYLVDTINADDQLLIVDDVFDSGRSVDAIIKELTTRCRRNTPADIRVATVYYKPEKNKTDRIPDFYIYETEKWLVFPHELDGLSAEEILKHKAFPPRGLEMAKKRQSA